MIFSLYFLIKMEEIVLTIGAKIDFYKNEKTVDLFVLCLVHLQV